MLGTTLPHMSHATTKHPLSPSPFSSKKKEDMLDHPPTAHMDSFTKPRKVRAMASPMRKTELVPQKPTEKILADLFEHILGSYF